MIFSADTLGLFNSLGSFLGDVAILITAISGLVVALRNSGRIKQVHQQVNGRQQAQDQKIQELTAKNAELRATVRQISDRKAENQTDV